MQIRPARSDELEALIAIYAEARQFMRATGNRMQWTGGYPSREVILEDLSEGRLYVCVENDALLGVFCYFFGEDPTYRHIDGAWQSDAPYGVIHRIAVAATAHGKGVAAACFAYAIEQAGNVRIDTHADNLPMQRALEKNGFVRCGVIYLQNGDPRYAYQKIQGEERNDAADRNGKACL